jgi:hypothetical protein
MGKRRRERSVPTVRLPALSSTTLRRPTKRTKTTEQEVDDGIK